MFRYDSFACFAVDEVAMQRAQESPPARAPEPSSPRLFSPLRVFVVLLLVIAALTALVLLTRPANEVAEEAPATTDALALTNAEAIARFKELNELRLQMYAARDLSLVSLFLTHDSPLRERANDEISQLIEDGIEVRPRFDTRSLVVVANDAGEITIRQRVIERPIFVSESGSEVTESNPLLRVLDWRLHPDESRWKIFDVDVVRSNEIDQSG